MKSKWHEQNNKQNHWFSLISRDFLGKLNILLSGDANQHQVQESMSGVYYMQPGTINGQPYWMSSEGNAIWVRNDESKWFIASEKYLGSTTSSIYVSIKDPNIECPHYDLQSNWKYYTGQEFLEDANNSVRIHCLKGNATLW